MMLQARSADSSDRRARRASPVMRSPGIRAIGRRAHAALVRSGGALNALPGFDHVHYAQAAGEIVWIGDGEPAMHPRAVILDEACDVSALDVGGIAPWSPPAFAPGGQASTALRAGCVALSRLVRAIGEPKGFAAMLVGATPAFPLDRSTAKVHALARAFRDADHAGVFDAAIPLLGLGPGLTPAGDDLVGAALFARHALAASRGAIEPWREVAHRLTAAAQVRCHPIGAALFGDLASGESFAPLHRLAAVLRADCDQATAIDAARDVVAIGHSSGWEMLYGFIIGVTGHATPLFQGST